jgi:hypothetical protein
VDAQVKGGVTFWSFPCDITLATYIDRQPCVYLPIQVCVRPKNILLSFGHHQMIYTSIIVKYSELFSGANVAFLWA